MIVALAYCHKDALAALHLLTWIRALAARCSLESETLILSCSRIAENHSLTERIRSTACEAFGRVIKFVPQSQDERGWPWSPNHIFRETVKACECRISEPMLWIEPDSIPTRCDWLAAIKSEYSSYDMFSTFMGPVMSQPTDHMNGVGVYPVHAARLAPSICDSSINLPWDVASGPEHSNYLVDSKLFKHIWNCIVTRELYEPQTAIFHRDKRGETIGLLDEELTGSKIQTRLELATTMPTKYFSTVNATKRHKVGGVTYSFEPYTVVAGTLPGITASDSEEDQLALSSLASDPRNGIKEITKEKYDELLKKKAGRAGGPKGSVVFDSANRHIVAQVAKPVQSSEIRPDPRVAITTPTGQTVRPPEPVAPVAKQNLIDISEVATVGPVIPSAPVQTFQVPKKRGRPRKT